MVVKWLATAKRSVSGIRPSDDSLDLKVRKIKPMAAYIIYLSVVPLNVACLVTITSNLQLRVSNQIFYAVGTSYLIDFFLVQTLKALFQAVLVIYLYKGAQSIEMTPRKRFFKKFLNEDLE